MVTRSRSLSIWFALFTLLLVVACGGGDTAETTADGLGDTAAAKTAVPGGADQAEPAGGSVASPEAESVAEFFKDMAATKGIYFGEVPEGFPLDIITLHPDGKIDNSAVNEEDFTLLQMVTGDKESIFGWFKDHFDDIGYRAGNPFTMGNRTMVGFTGSDGEVSMTLIDKEDGKVFVAQVLSPL